MLLLSSALLPVSGSKLEAQGHWFKTEVPKKHILPQTMELNFITFTNPDETRKADSRRFIRTQVLKKYHAKRRSDKQKQQIDQAQRTLAPRNGEPQIPVISDEHIEVYPVANVVRVPSPETRLNPGSVDTFCVLPINLSDNDRFFLDRYIEFAKSLDNLIDVTGKKKPLVTNYLPAAVKDPITLFAVLQTGAQCIEKSDQDQQSSRHARYYTGYYRGRLLQSINEALNDKTKTATDSMIAGLVKLETDEYLEGNREQFDLHAGALRKVIRLCGGLEKLGMQGFLADLVLRVDQAAASYFASEPYYPQPRPIQLPTAIDALNPGFLHSPILSNLSPDITTLLNTMCTISTAFNTNAGNLPDTGTTSWAVAGECEKHLMILCAQRKSTPTTPHAVPEIQESVCLAAELFWMRVLRNYAVGTYGGPLASQDLLDCLNRLLKTDEYREFCDRHVLELLLWVAFMGSLALDTVEAARVWAGMIALVARKLGIGNWEEARVVLESFLWLEGRSEMLGRNTWEWVESLMAV